MLLIVGLLRICQTVLCRNVDLLLMLSHMAGQVETICKLLDLTLFPGWLGKHGECSDVVYAIMGYVIVFLIIGNKIVTAIVSNHLIRTYNVRLIPARVQFEICAIAIIGETSPN